MHNINGWNIPQQGDKFNTNWAQMYDDFMSKYATIVNSATNEVKFYLPPNDSTAFTLSGSNGNIMVVDTTNSATPTLKYYGAVSATGGIWDGTYRVYSDGNKPNLSALPGNITLSQISATGSLTSATYLRGDGQWSVVTSIGATGALSASPTSVISVTNGNGSVIGNGVGLTISQATSSTNGYVSSGDWNTFNSKASSASLSAYIPQSTSGAFSLSGHNHNGTYLTVGTSALFALSAHNQSWSTISSTPTTLSGYGITDGLDSSTSAWFATSAHQHQQSDITSSAGWITSATTLTETVISTVSAGAIIPGQSLTSGMSFTTFVKNLLLKTFYPTFVVPSASLASSLAASIETGTTGNVTLTVTYNRGQINGKTVGGIWEPATLQDYRAGIASNYNINGVDMGTSASSVDVGHIVVDGSNTWSSTVTYVQGPQPVDSLGANYSTPLTSGTLSPTVTVTGKRKAFYGTDSSSAIPYTTTAQIRAIANSVLGPVTATAFTINIPIGAKMVVFAYPATLRDVNSVIYIQGLGSDVKGIFTQTTINVEGVSGYTAISYKVYTYVPASPFSAIATYNVTI